MPKLKKCLGLKLSCTTARIRNDTIMIHSSSHHSVHNYNILKREITRVNDDGNSSAVCRSKGDSKAFRRRGRRMCAKQLALISEIATLTSENISVILLLKSLLVRRLQMQEPVSRCGFALFWISIK